MPNRVNTLLAKEYARQYRDVDTFFSIGYEGLDVEATNQLRARLADRSIRLFFVKNRMIRRAMSDLERVDITPICQGQTALADGAEDPVGLARLLVDFQKDHKELRIHGAVVEDTLLDEGSVKDLSKAPSREELKGMIAGQALAPGAAIGGALLGPAGRLASQIEKIAEAAEEPAA